MLAPRSEKRKDILHLAALLPFNIWFPILLLARYFIYIFLLGGINRLFRIHQHYSHCNIILRPHSLTSSGTERETGQKKFSENQKGGPDYGAISEGYPFIPLPEVSAQKIVTVPAYPARIIQERRCTVSASQRYMYISAPMLFSFSIVVGCRNMRKF